MASLHKIQNKMGLNKKSFDLKLLSNSGEKLYRLIVGSVANSFKSTSENTTDI
jgi:hypothetical protein